MVLPNGVIVLDRDLFIWQAYNFRCVAHPLAWAVCLHEFPPKSHNPRWLDHPEWRFPVCAACHDYVHRLSAKDAGPYLEGHRARNFPEAERIINERRLDQRA